MLFDRVHWTCDVYSMYSGRDANLCLPNPHGFVDAAETEKNQDELAERGVLGFSLFFVEGYLRTPLSKMKVPCGT